MDKKPNLFIVGAMKAGTTFLYDNLVLSDFVDGGKIKEPNYFIKDFVDYNNFSREYKEHTVGVDSNNTHIAYLTDEAEYLANYSSNSSKYYLDSSVSYLYFSDVASAIKKFNKDSKIIICLRNPTERAISHFKMDSAIGRTKLKFEEQFFLDMRSDRTWGKKSFYYECGLYYDSLIEYIDVFGDSNVHIVLFNELIEKPNLVAKKLSVFLGVEVEIKAGNNNLTQVAKYKYLNYILQKFGFKAVIKKLLPESIKSLLKKAYYKKAEKETNSMDKINQLYVNDVAKLSKVTGLDLQNIWNIK